MIYDLPFFHTRWSCMHLIYTPACKFAQNFDAMLIYDFFLSLCFIYGDHACISSILQIVSLLKILMQCWFMISFSPFVSYTGTRRLLLLLAKHNNLHQVMQLSNDIILLVIIIIKVISVEWMWLRKQPLPSKLKRVCILSGTASGFVSQEEHSPQSLLNVLFTYEPLSLASISFLKALSLWVLCTGYQVLLSSQSPSK